MTSRLRLLPFVTQPTGDRVLVGRADGSDWIELDRVGATVLQQLDQGLTIAEVQQQIASQVGTPVDVLAFARELTSLGFAMPSAGPPAQARQALPRHVVRWPWLWWVCLAGSALGLGYTAWAFGSGRVVLPGGADLLLPGLPLGGALVLWLVATLILATIHELAHVAVARMYGLRPRIRLSRRGLWRVAETDLTGVWILPWSLRWRPVLAGLLADTIVLGGMTLLAQLAAQPTTVVVARMVQGIVLTHMLWQWQWYLRTDLYFLLAVVGRTLNLRQTAWLWLQARLRSATPEQVATLATVPAHEQRIARIYLGSLPVAFAASVVLWSWMLIPLGVAVVRRVIG